LGALPYLACTVRLAVTRLTWRSLGRSLLANVVRVQLGLGLAAGGGAASPSVLATSSVDTQKNKSFYKGSSAMPQSTIKNSAVRHAEPFMFRA